MRIKVLCMICGKKMESIFDNTYANVNEGVTFEIRMPYGSVFDGNTYKAALCDECISKCIEEKKISLEAQFDEN